MNAIAKMPATAQQRGKIAPAKLAHVALRTSQPGKVVSFYKMVLEAEVFYANDNLSFLTYDDEHHRLAILRVPGLRPSSRARAGVDHVAFTYRSLAELLSTYVRLKDAGITPVWTTHHGATLSFYYADPDNNMAELQVDVHENVEDLEAYLASEDFNLNPVGVDFDPEEIRARFEKGECPADILVRHADGPRDMATIPKEILGGLHWFLVRLTSKLGRKLHQ